SEIINRQISRCSAGQIKRFSLSRLELTRKKIWLLDEPSVALDTASLDALRSRIAEHRNSGGMVVASTHAELGFEDAATLDVSAFNGREAVPI
ncbi:ABC transporter ATP-binding protein, partial [Thioclava electrotropha]|uniref:ABC transporter ATP-binding protein n=1 Tax=Thioclava electrotropha TaxID=1549850 RepID=UPI003F72D549